jgi:membrane protein implicated in regulation of membrane protease activity
MSQTITNKQGSLQGRDFIKGLLIAVLTAVLALVQTSLSAGELNFDWKVIGTAALSAGLAYIVKNWLEPTQTITIHDTPKG